MTFGTMTFNQKRILCNILTRRLNQYGENTFDYNKLDNLNYEDRINCLIDYLYTKGFTKNNLLSDINKALTFGKDELSFQRKSK
jgi:hypothetical protein